ncbi:non-ribosomal peptide synthetase [Variovorax saccharolyticus]|uniref:non-ribosomal peptide synthetase n=1 Tax=Variovorax saccharolyticus TaxID=3053516 RepID=UPI0025781757|nr:amino acid adenylation domain-containing protein [Variovorax sp. J22R187]MDM0020713.1 amino acid adenylation domain-containing protein [Variovorax sp. J22R187]
MSSASHQTDHLTSMHGPAGPGEFRILTLPADRHRVPRPDGAHENKTLSCAIDPALAAAVRALAARHDASPFMALLAAFEVLLMRYSAETDIAVGVMLDGGAGDTVMRNRLDGESAFIALLKQVRETTRAATDRLAQQPAAGDHSRHDPPQVSFALEALEAPDAPAGTSSFDLSLKIIDTGTGMEAVFGYRDDLFEPRTIVLMGEHLLNLLRGIVADPEGALIHLPLMGAAEQHRMLFEWNRTVPPLPPGPPVHALFRAQARATPDAVALRYGQRELSYRELDLLSDRLAHALRAQGAGPEQVVGLCMRRCIGAAVALLAIFKAGAVLLPLDPAHPAERLQAMLDDAAPAVLLTQAGLADLLQRTDASLASKCIVVPDDGGEPPPEPLAELPDPTRPDQLAYLIYTSGSTGTPKAAQLMHQGLSNHVRWISGALGLGREDRVLQKTSSSFDASLWEFFSPLCCGATLVIGPPDVHQDMRLLAAAIRDHGISVVQFVPSELRVLLDHLGSLDFPKLRYVLSGGEALDRALASAFQKRLPGVRLGNFYGPTEATVDSAWYEVGDQLPDRPFVPIGHPIANAQLYVLDAQCQPQPVNVPGELYVGGLGVGRGYLHRPELSAARFLPNPFRPGEKMYRTGDSARWLHDGVVEFIGRSDDQVKLRGFRIELGEIEARLQAHPNVAQALVVMREDRLLAYLVLRDGVLDTQRLRDHLRSSLPDYMLPHHFIALDALPLLPNGKVDRHALPAFSIEARPDPTAVDAPSTAAERALAGIWHELLDLGSDSVARSDNFFDLGGDSLKVGQAVIAFHRRSGVRLDGPRMVFESLAQLVHGIELPEAGPSPQQAPAAATTGWLKRLFKRA